jgi:hypothetical protein
MPFIFPLLIPALVQTCIPGNGEQKNFVVTITFSAARSPLDNFNSKSWSDNK